jgi:hypothetical protein
MNALGELIARARDSYSRVRETNQLLDWSIE